MLVEGATGSRDPAAGFLDDAAVARLYLGGPGARRWPPAPWRLSMSWLPFLVDGLLLGATLASVRWGSR